MSYKLRVSSVSMFVVFSESQVPLEVKVGISFADESKWALSKISGREKVNMVLSPIHSGLV